MPNRKLRAKIARIVNAPNTEAMNEALEALGPELLTDETDAELAAWIEEVKGTPEAATLARLRNEVDPIRRAMAQGPQAMLFGTFMAVNTVDEMIELVEVMPRDMLDEMLHVVEERLPTLTGAEALDVRERLGSLQDVRAQMDAAESPEMLVLQEFLALDSDVEARDLLLTLPDLLLSEPAGALIQKIKVNDAALQARIKARFSLWQQVRQEHITARGCSGSGASLVGDPGRRRDWRQSSGRVPRRVRPT